MIKNVKTAKVIFPMKIKNSVNYTIKLLKLRLRKKNGGIYV